MILYVDGQFASPYAMVVYVSLLEKGVTFDMHSGPVCPCQPTAGIRGDLHDEARPHTRTR